MHKNRGKTKMKLTNTTNGMKHSVRKHRTTLAVLYRLGSVQLAPITVGIRLCAENLTEVWGNAFRISAAVLLASASLSSAQTPQVKLLTGHLPTVVSKLQPLGHLEAPSQLKLSINLPLHNQGALTNLLEQLYDPASPLYHHYLTPEEFDARFGPTEQDYQAVDRFAATSSGFTVTARHPNRMLLEVSASVTDIERALQVTMRTYAHPTEPRTFFAPDTEPSVGMGIPILIHWRPGQFRPAASEEPAALSVAGFRESHAPNDRFGTELAIWPASIIGRPTRRASR